MTVFRKLCCFICLHSFSGHSPIQEEEVQQEEPKDTPKSKWYQSVSLLYLVLLERTLNDLYNMKFSHGRNFHGFCD